MIGGESITICCFSVIKLNCLSMCNNKTATALLKTNDVELCCRVQSQTEMVGG